MHEYVAWEEVIATCFHVYIYRGFTFFFSFFFCRNGAKQLDGSSWICLLARWAFWPFPWLQHHLLLQNRRLGWQEHHLALKSNLVFNFDKLRIDNLIGNKIWQWIVFAFPSDSSRPCHWQFPKSDVSLCNPLRCFTRPHPTNSAKDFDSFIDKPDRWHSSGAPGFTCTLLLAINSQKLVSPPP